MASHIRLFRITSWSWLTIPPKCLRVVRCGGYIQVQVTWVRGEVVSLAEHAKTIQSAGLAIKLLISMV